MQVSPRARPLEMHRTEDSTTDSPAFTRSRTSRKWKVDVPDRDGVLATDGSGVRLEGVGGTYDAALRRQYPCDMFHSDNLTPCRIASDKEAAKRQRVNVGYDVRPDG